MNCEEMQYGTGNFREKREGVKGEIKYNSMLNTSNLGSLTVKMCIY